MSPDKNWVVYLVRCADQSLYCGVTNNLEKRLQAHNLGKGAKYTRSRTPVELLGTSREMTKSDALKLEHRIKRTPARRKRFELENEKSHQEILNAQILEELQNKLQSVINGIQRFSDTGHVVECPAGQISTVTRKKKTR